MPRRVEVPAFSAYLYRFRNPVERFFSKLKHYRAVATRFEQHDEDYLALIRLAAARIWMRFVSAPTDRGPIRHRHIARRMRGRSPHY
jgi:IS4 transposase